MLHLLVESTHYSYIFVWFIIIEIIRIFEVPKKNTEKKLAYSILISKSVNNETGI